ncbi:putative quinol monooxygenase [Aureimonas altamirensis]|jgi:quinol monooxygenase YgiN|uniref:putative quinol monooxygenase n=1 Tax=Aureimonas altamirensis TaxID=370622 RepID=UPI00301659D0
MYAIFLKHRARPGHRGDLEAVWQRHMRPAIESNPGHVAYTYSFGTEADLVAAFQIYRSKDDADAFLRSPAYVAYLQESRPLLLHDPEVTALEPRWIKGG